MSIVAEFSEISLYLIKEFLEERAEVIKLEFLCECQASPLRGE